MCKNERNLLLFYDAGCNLDIGCQLLAFQIFFNLSVKNVVINKYMSKTAHFNANDMHPR